MEHIIARQHGGQTILDNLAWACHRCNRRKGPNLTGIDPSTHEIAPLFHPRRDVWSASRASRRLSSSSDWCDVANGSDSSGGFRLSALELFKVECKVEDDLDRPSFARIFVVAVDINLQVPAVANDLATPLLERHFQVLARG